jgi:hypothetical protein
MENVDDSYEPRTQTLIVVSLKKNWFVILCFNLNIESFVHNRWIFDHVQNIIPVGIK